MVERVVVDKIQEETGIDLENLSNVEEKLKKELGTRAVNEVINLFGRN